MISGKRILITGGAGFIGTHVADQLVEQNDLTLLDINLSGPIRYTKLGDHANVRLLEADVRDAAAVEDAVSRADVVLHFASLIGVRNVIANARETIETILDGTRNVLEAARKNGKIERLINISTSEVYGNSLDAIEGAPASVGTGNDARLCYASSKLMGEHLVWAYHREFDLPTVIVRPFNIYGSRRLTENAVSIFIVKALEGADLTIHGDGSQIRSWCYITDFVSAIMKCLDCEAAVGQDFNFGHPVTAVTIFDLAQRIIRLSGSDSKLTTTEHTFTDIGVRAPNSTKSRETLGFVAQYDLEMGLTETIAWHREHLNDFSHWL